MKASIEIRGVVQHAGRSKKTGNDYDMRMAQCVVRGMNRDTGAATIQVGVLSLPERYKDLVKGAYMVEFDVAIVQNSRVGAEVFDIAPYDAAAFSVPGRRSKIEVLGIVPMSGFSKKNMKEYDMRLAQCIVHRADRETGVIDELAGELLLPQRYKDIAPGVYEVEFEVSIGNDKRIGSQVATMTLIPDSAVPAPVSSAPADSHPKPGVGPVKGAQSAKHSPSADGSSTASF